MPCSCSRQLGFRSRSLSKRQLLLYRLIRLQCLRSAFFSQQKSQQRMCTYKDLCRHCVALAVACLQYHLLQAPLAMGGGSNIFASVVERLASGLTVWCLCKISIAWLGACCNLTPICNSCLCVRLGGSCTHAVHSPYTFNMFGSYLWACHHTCVHQHGHDRILLHNFFTTPMMQMQRLEPDSDDSASEREEPHAHPGSASVSPALARLANSAMCDLRVGH